MKTPAKKSKKAPTIKELIARATRNYVPTGLVEVDEHGPFIPVSDGQHEDKAKGHTDHLRGIIRPFVDRKTAFKEGEKVAILRCGPQNRGFVVGPGTTTAVVEIWWPRLTGHNIESKHIEYQGGRHAGFRWTCSCGWYGNVFEGDYGSSEASADKAKHLKDHGSGQVGDYAKAITQFCNMKARKKAMKDHVIVLQGRGMKSMAHLTKENDDTFYGACATVRYKYTGSLGLEITDLLESRIKAKKIAVETGGHEIYFDPMQVRMRLLDPEDGVQEALMEALKTGTKMTTPFVIGEASRSYGGCGYCGVKVPWTTDGTRVYTDSVCAFPNGLEYSFELNVPSGVMIVANDLRPAFEPEGDFSINAPSENMKCTLAYAEIGCAHAFVGNSCPAVYMQEDGTMLIGSPGYTRGGNEKKNDPRFANRVASICTDLWWYSIVDQDEFTRRGLKLGYSGAEPVTVKPGVYRFAHYFFRRDFDHDAYDKPTVYSKIEWVREPDPVRDFAAERAGMNFTAGQVIANSIKKWPTLYSGHFATRSVADHIMCVIGGGGSWHENGFVVYDPEMKASDPEVAIPDFSDPTYRAVREKDELDELIGRVREERWYPLCEYSGLVKAGKGQIHLNPSFVALARNVAKAVMSVPEPKQPSGGSTSLKDTITAWRRNVKAATEALAGIDKLYDETGNLRKPRKKITRPVDD